MKFAGEITHIDPKGQVRRVPATSFGQFIREETDDQLVPITTVALQFKKILTGHSSYWPSRGRTANYGPYSKNNSIRLFSVTQSRTQAGRFSRIIMRNDARNKKGVAYAGYVARGIRSGGGTVSPDRYRANYDAVHRTWRDRWPLLTQGLGDGS